MMSVGRVLVLLMTIAASASCGGLLLLDERSANQTLCANGCPPLTVCDGSFCVETSPCNLATAGLADDGLPLYCPDGFVCRAGLCINPDNVSYCDCLPSEACVAGACLPIDDSNRCGQDHPNGLCPEGAACRDGECLLPPGSDACSTTNPAGFCPPGFSCPRGYCIPTTEHPCSPQTGMGICSWGYECVDPGPACVAVTEPCSERAPQGTCETGEICVRGQCTCIACSLVNTHGCCPTGDTCSTAGACVPQGTCGGNGDCEAGLKCSCAGHAPATCEADPACAICIWESACRCDEDCEAGEHCDLNTSQCTANLDCTADDQCGAGGCCDATDHCRACGTCGATADCRGDGEFCCATGLCQPPGGCCAESECSPSAHCIDSLCLNQGECRLDAHCGPGHMCTAEHLCTVSPSLVCDATRVTGLGRQACAANEQSLPSCCATGQTCCKPSQHCSTPSPYPPSTARVCIDELRCFADADCVTPTFHCNTRTFTCEPVSACSSDCPSGSRCSAAGGCVPDNLCTVGYDCPNGEVCNEMHACERAVACGDQIFDASRVKPNVLVVLDRSSSMQLSLGRELQDGGGCCGSPGDDLACGLCTAGSPADCATCDLGAPATCTLPTRWQHALSAIDSITAAYSDVIRFGLATYPRPWCGAGACLTPGNYCSCDLQYCTDGRGTCVADLDEAAECHPNYEAGQVDVSVAESQRAAISSFLAATYAGGGTPTSQTLRGIAQRPSDAGVASVDRQNYVVLITDGAANGDVEPIVGCRNTDYTCKVGKALDSLRGLPRSVTAYVVGFAFAGVSVPLNCYAEHGARATCTMPITCGALTEKARCENKGCIWLTGHCEAPACTSYATAPNCQAAGCQWATSTCGGTPDCKALTNACYYTADDAASLVSELGTIIGEVSSCSFALGSPPYDLDRLYVYFLHDAIEERIEQDLTGQDGWDFVPVPPFGQVEFHGNACDRVKSGTVAPLIVYGCDVGGG
jgi:hypothetical protein